MSYMAYDSALICKNGHLINDNVHQYPEYNCAFCEKCGSPAISTCPHCNKEIRGRSNGEFSYIGDYDVPAYCIYCGKPFPWTETAIESATLIIQEEESLNEQQQNALIETLPDIITETPKTNVAVVRMKKCFTSAGKFTIDALRQFAIDFGCELAKNSLGL